MIGHSRVSYFVAIMVSVCAWALSFAASQAFYEINATGGGCRSIGNWEATNRTCTLTTDISEPIIITTSAATLEGAGHTIDIDDMSGEKWAVRVNSVEGVAVQNLNVIGGGIIFDQADSGRAKSNVIESSFSGIHFFDQIGGLVEGNVVRGSSDAPLWTAVSAQNAANLEIRNNFIEHAAVGIDLNAVSGSVVKENRIAESTTGVSIDLSSSNTITANDIARSNIALTLQTDNAAGNIITNNAFRDGNTGVVVVASSDAGGPGDEPIPTFGAAHQVRKIALSEQLKKLAHNFAAIVRSAVSKVAYAQAESISWLYGNNFINNDTHVDVPEWATEVAFSHASLGGNYWDTFDEVGEGCANEDADDFCDQAYELNGFGLFDEFPRTAAQLVELPLAQCSDGIDNDADGLIDFPADPGCATADDFIEVNPPAPTCVMYAAPATITAGGTTTLSWTSEHAASVEIDAGIGAVDPTGELVVSPTDTTTYTAMFTSVGGSNNCQVTVAVQSAPEPEPEPEPTPELTLGERAAELAKQLLAAAVQSQADPGDVYELGSRGWNYIEGYFVDPHEIVSGYYQKNHYYNYERVAPGIDCSGLIYWAFNKANDPTEAHDNYVANVTADGMFGDVQSSEVVGELEPGDALFFGDDSRISHVAMYVGESEGYDVVNASSEDLGVIQGESVNYEKDSDFVERRRIHQHGFSSASTFSPVDLIVTDPDGLTLSYEDVIPSDLEYIREVPGVMYYSEIERGHDGQSIDRVYFTELKDGVYTFEVAPDETATSGSQYSLVLNTGQTVIELAKDELVSEIPPQGFAVEVSGGGEVIEEVEVPLNTKQLFSLLNERIDEAEIQNRFLRLRLEANLKLAEKHYNKNRKRAASAILKNLNRLVERRAGRGMNNSDADEINDIISQLIAKLKYE